jgi:uroporphyrinogen-III synthase
LIKEISKERLPREVIEPWISKPIFVVGPGTHAEAQKLGFIRIYGQESGQASKLGPFILSFYNESKFEEERMDRGKRLLFLVGDKRRDILPDFLKSNSISFSEILVYETMPGLTFAKEYQRWKEKYLKDQEKKLEFAIWISLFSPSGIDIALPHIQSDLSSIKIASIGPTTSEHLENLGLQVHAQAESPTLESLVQAIRSQES